MKASNMRELTDEELRQKVSSYKEELFNLRFQMATGQLDNPMRIRDIKNIARCKTVLQEEKSLSIKSIKEV